MKFPPTKLDGNLTIEVEITLMQAGDRENNQKHKIKSFNQDSLCKSLKDLE